MKTLNDVMTANKWTPQHLAENQSDRDKAARELLKSRGVDAPSYDLVKQTEQDIQEAVKNDTWAKFVAAPTKKAKGPAPLSKFFVDEAARQKFLTDTDDWSRRSKVQEIAADCGAKLTEAETDKLVEEIQTALKGEDWASFVPQINQRLVAVQNGARDKDRSMFSEQKRFTDDAKSLQKLRYKDAEAATKAFGDYESGKMGMLLSATFIERDKRANADFSRANGERAWDGYQKAYALVDEIPVGGLADKLDIALLKQINSTIDEGPKGFVATVKSWFGVAPEKGTLRSQRSFTSPAVLNEAQIALAEAAGLTVASKTAAGKKGPAIAGETAAKFTVVFEHPAAAEVEKKLQQILNDVRRKLANPNSDPLQVAGKLYASLIALHPFADYNERTAALITNRVLRDMRMPPMVFAEAQTPYTMAKEAWQSEVASACARSRAFLDGTRHSWASYIGGVTQIKMVEQPTNQPITIDGVRFDLGEDGFLYDLNGRPHIVFGNELQPLAQLEYYSMARRLIGRPAEAAKEAQTKLTKATIAAYEAISQKREVALKRIDDQAARRADSTFDMIPNENVASIMFALCDVDAMDKEWMFKVDGSRGTPSTDIISQYSQIDLELWMVQQGMKKQGHHTHAQALFAEREALFSLAKEALAKAKTAALEQDQKQAADNASFVKPNRDENGFSKNFEALMLSQSPLRFASLAEAIRKEGDDDTTVWRGDYAIARWIGMAPNNDIREPDARKVGKERYGVGVVGHLVEELQKLEGSAIGTRYICTTSDLALLVGAFASNEKSQEVNLSGVPTPVRNGLFWFLDRVTKPIKKEPKKAWETENKAEADLVPSLLAGKGKREIRDQFGVPGRAVALENKEGKLEVSVPRKAMALRLSKTALLPGIRVQRKQTFSAEQEQHGIERVSPFAVRLVVDAKDLGLVFDEKGKPIPDPSSSREPAPGQPGFIGPLPPA